MLKTSDFDFDLPESFIAQDPVVPRDHSRLMVYDAKKGRVFHKRFYEVVDFLGSDDVLVMNRSKVVPARIVFEVNGSRKEVFFLKKLGGSLVNCLVRPGRWFCVGREGVLGDVSWKVVDVLDDGSRVFDFSEDIYEVLDRFGEMPLPPYINRSKADDGQYQTVYAQEKGSVAAPTAGLHFTPRLFESLNERDVQREEVLLHVGRGTFLPVSSDDLSEHVMHSEEFELKELVVKRLNAAVKEKRQLVAVGTTSVRVLESNFVDGEFVAGRGATEIFIYPGAYQWKCVDKLITNFHLPKSTLIMLVASFLESKGVEDPVKKVLELYEIAKSEGYRFYSFGDAMMIV